MRQFGQQRAGEDRYRGIRVIPKSPRAYAWVVVLTLRAQTEATLHQEFSYQLPKPALTWTAVEGLPSGLRIIPEDARIWGAPNEAGLYRFALRASDNTQITLDLKVNAL